MDYSGLYPEFVLLAAVILIVFFVFLIPRHAAGFSVWIALASLGLSFFSIENSEAASLLPSGLQAGAWVPVLKAYFCIASSVCLFAWLEWQAGLKLRPNALFPALLLIACLSLMLLVQAGSLWMMLLAAEGFSFVAYALAYNSSDQKNNAVEVLRYFGIGTLATAISVFGLSWMLGFEQVILSSQSGFGDSLAFFPVAGAVLFLSFLLFKTGSFPFQQWVPEVFSKAPSPVAGFLASAPKVAAAFACFHFVQKVNVNLGIPLLCFALFTGVLGNLAAFRSYRLREILAYSSIGQAAFLLIPSVFAPQVAGAESQLLYFCLAYGSSVQAAFAACQFFEKHLGEELNLTSFEGVFHQLPLASILLTALLASIVGLPPFAGFTAKLLILSSLPVGSGLLANLWPSAVYVFSLIITVLSAAYFLQIPYAMFFRKGNGNALVEGSVPFSLIIMVAGIMIQLIAFFIPAWFLP
jgi:NADH-quinone oxidoreductase subunit N